MSMKYYKLFDLLARRGMKKTDLLNYKIISSPTLAKLSKGETVTTEVLSNICEALHCQPGDIMEYIPNQPGPNSLTSQPSIDAANRILNQHTEYQ